MTSCILAYIVPCCNFCKPRNHEEDGFSTCFTVNNSLNWYLMFPYTMVWKCKQRFIPNSNYRFETRKTYKIRVAEDIFNNVQITLLSACLIKAGDGDVNFDAFICN